MTPPLTIVPKVRGRSRSLAVFVERLDLEDGDTLVVRCDAVLCCEQVEYLRVHLKPIVPDGVKTLILDRGMSLGVIRKKAV